MRSRRAKVLIVDGDRESCLSLHGVLYEANDCLDVLLASTASIAREIMRDGGVDVLITDAELSGSSSLDLVCWAAVEFPETLFVIQTSNDVRLLQKRIATLGCLRLLPKPCNPLEILKIVREALDCIHRLSGCFSALSAADLIQMLCLGQRTAALRITADNVVGAVMVKNGKLVHAAWGDLSGQDALCAILDAQDGVFRMTPLPPDVEINIHSDWQQALLEAVRVLDERAYSSPRQSGSFPAIRIEDSLIDAIAAPLVVSDRQRLVTDGLDTRRSLRPIGAAASLVDKGFVALRAGNVEEARQCWLAAKELDPENRSLDLNLKKLESRAAR